MSESDAKSRRPIPVIGTPPPDPTLCRACHGTRYFWDQGGHGAFDWKRPCFYCKRGA